MREICLLEMGNKLDLHQHFAELVDYPVEGCYLHRLSDILLLI